MGTFLVRSGVLTSVHAFAVDPRRGVFILAIMGLLIGGALALYAWRAPRLEQGGLFAPISREGALVLNNILLTTGCATVFIGTLYPLLLESLTGAKISVGPALLQSHLRARDAAAAAGDAVRAVPRLETRRPRRRAAAPVRGGACGPRAARRRFALFWRGPWLAPFGIALGVWVVAGALCEWAARVKLFGAGSEEVLAPRPRRCRARPMAAMLAHAGIGLSVIGIVATSAWQSESVVAMRPATAPRLPATSSPSAASRPRKAPTTRSRSASSPCRAAALP